MQAAIPTLSLWPDEDPPVVAPRGRVAKDWRLYENVLEHPGHGATPKRLQRIFYEAETGWWLEQIRLFNDQIEQDGHLRNLFEQLEGAIGNKDWDLQADGTEGDSELGADILELALNDLPMAKTFGHQLRAVRHGAAETEIDWVIKRINGRDWVVPGWLADVPLHRFRVDCHTDRLKLITEANPVSGEDLVAGKWWETRMPGDSVVRAGMMRTASWLALAKRDNAWDWVIYAHKFGIPGVLARIPQSASKEAKAALKRFVERFGIDGGAFIEEPPDGEAKIDIADAPVADSSGTHGGLITYCNREMSKLVNGSTLSNDNSDSGGASYALGQVHESSKWDAIQNRKILLKESFKQCVAVPFWRYNRLTGRPPNLEIRVVREERPLEMIELAERSVKLGVPVSASQVRGITGLHAPLGDDDAIGKKAAAANGNEQAAPGVDADGKPKAAPDPAAAKVVTAEEFIKRVEAYGVAVRAGAITPSPSDEAAFRKEFGLPEMSADVLKAWADEDGVRRPITLQPPGGGQAGQPPSTPADPGKEAA